MRTERQDLDALDYAMLQLDIDLYIMLYRAQTLGRLYRCAGKPWPEGFQEVLQLLYKAMRIYA